MERWLATMLLCALTTNAHALAGNILVNGNFEAPLTADGQIPGWQANAALQQQQVWLDRSQARGGAHSVAIRSQARTDQPGILSQDVAVEPDRNYTLTLWALRDSFVYGTRVEVHLFNGDQPVGRQDKSLRTSVWRPLNMVFSSGAANRASVRIVNPNKGEWRITVGRTLWIDDVSLVPIDPARNMPLAGSGGPRLETTVDVLDEGHYYLWTRVQCARGTHFRLEAGGAVRDFRCYSAADGYWLRPILPEFILDAGSQQIAIAALDTAAVVQEAVLTMDPFWQPEGAPEFLPPATAKSALLETGFTPAGMGRVDLTVQGEVPAGRWGLTQGVPFPQGVLAQPQNTRMAKRALQTEPLAYWPDGSVKWLLVSTLATAGETLPLEYGADVRQSAPAPGPLVRVDDAGGVISVDTGSLRFEVPRDGSALLRNLRCADRTVSSLLGLVNEEYSSANAPADIRIEEAGPVRAVVRVGGEHRNEQGAKLLDYIVRIVAYAGAEYLELEHSFVLTDDIVEVDLDSVLLRLQTASTRAVLLAGDTPLESELAAGPLTLTAGVSLPDSSACNYPFSVTQGGQELATGTEARGAFTFTGPGRLTVAVRDFWQNAPKRLTVTSEQVAVGLVGGPITFYIGMAKTHHVLLSFAADDRPLELFEQRPLLLASADWYGNSRALNGWPLPARDGAWQGYEQCVADTIADWRNRTASGMRRTIGAGMLHYGDTTYSKGGNNLETALGEGIVLQFLRSGNREYFDLADIMIRHFADIDIDHSQANGGLIWVHGPHARTRIDDPWRWTLDQIDFELTAGQHTLKVRPRYDRLIMDAFCLAKAGTYFPTLAGDPPPSAMIFQAEDGRLPQDTEVLEWVGALGGRAVRMRSSNPEQSIEIPFEIPEPGTYRFFARTWKGFADLLNVTIDDQPEVLCKQTHDMDGNPYPAWTINTTLGEQAVVPVWHEGNRKVRTYDPSKLHPWNKPDGI